jgi:hypothetical protein
MKRCTLRAVAMRPASHARRMTADFAASAGTFAVIVLR